ncbi:polyamine aminopropyltransferase [Nitrosomonas marina]|uniref:Spermidine synthase n=1 Tax=Nitrosomonas marina TaxID=917 RepID=A0A1H8CS11_9PROT|nr:polyamine aminopropyltransferase [Nitrosomonas marina]SEM98021.1 spermidine synthase [Nitrosomonas marina]
MTKSTNRQFYDGPEVLISECNGVRSLHLNGSMVQSAMRITAPNELELVYTQCMMGFLLFNPDPVHMLLIGLGGGSLAKFIYHNLSNTRITVVEINPKVVSAASQYFELPQENNRFEIIISEGGQFIAKQPLSTDVIMIDGFDDDYQAPSLCSQEFYDQARRMLTRNGMLVINLLSRDKQVKTLLRRIEQSFNGQMIAMLSEIRGNLIVFAFKRNPRKHSWKSLRKAAYELEKQYALPFTDFVAKMQKYD